MSDDDFFDFDVEDLAQGSGENEQQVGEEPDEDENREYHQMSSQTFKKLGKSKNVLGRNHTANLEFLEPRSKFEGILKDFGVRIGYDDHEMQHFVIFENSLNHHDFTKNLDSKMSAGRGSNLIFEEFSQACAKDFELYISPTKSKFGIQDTILSAFLASKTSQKLGVELLLQNLNQLARKSDEKSLNLSQICVGHLRSIERVFEPAPISTLIFAHNFQHWNALPRDSLISALPEILGADSGQQQEAARKLNDMILDAESILGELRDFQMTILETLKLLRMDGDNARIIRRNICHNSMRFDVGCLPALVSFSLGSLLPQNAQKSEENEVLFHELIQDFMKFLKIEKIAADNESDAIVLEFFSHFLRYLQLDKKGWKYLTTWINRPASQRGQIAKEEDEDQENPDENAENSIIEEHQIQNPFEVLLIFSILSSECCPPALISAVNSKITDLAAGSPTGIAKFLKIVDLCIGFRKFSIAHISSLIHVSRHCLWSQEANVRNLGVSIYKTLLVGMENQKRKLVFSELMKHFTQSDTECDAVLDVFFKVIRTNSDVLMEFGQEIQESIGCIMKLTIENVKKLFQVMILMSAKSSGTFEIDELIFNFLAAQNEKERFFGVLAMIMKVQCEMAKKHTEAQETAIQESLTKIETATKSSSILRGAFYAHFAEIVKNHRRNEEIRCVSKFAAKIGTIFKTQFFTEPEDGAMGFVLKPDEERFLEVVPMFNLIKELCVLQNRWHEDDDDSMQSSYDINILTELNFTIEAQIFTHPASSEVTRDEKMRQQFFVIQWCRSLLNAFFGQSSIDENISKSSLKIFYQMMDAEKRLLQNIQNVATWRIPNLDFENFEIEAAAKPGKRRAKKRKINEENEVLVEEEAVEEKENVDDLGLEANLREYYVPLKIRPVSHLLQLARTKRSCLIYLCNELSKIIQDLIKMRAKKSISGFLAQRQQTTPTKPCGRQKIDKFYHGDSLTIWNCIKKSMEEIWSIIENVFEFFEHLEENVENSGEKLERDMENLVEKCLKILNFVLGAELFGNPNEKLTNAEKNEKKSVIFMILERKINAESASATSKSDPEAARFEIAKYLLKNAKNAMNPTIAQLILETFENLKISPEKSELSRNMAKFALSYLKKDWSGSSDGKGARFNSAARDILRHYISLRKENEQISAIKWLLTNKVVQLVPDTDKRQSTVLSQQSEDVLMEKEDENAPFYCINKSTFPFIFKTLFSMLNSCVTKKELSAQALKSDQITEEDSLTYWENASSCFLILCLLLRVAKIRTVNVLYTAIKEGKQFFINVSRKSSFIYLVDNITTGQNFEIISTKIERIITAIQNGNRVLQAIGTYAKTSKCVNLLKKFPELRAESENCLRIIHSAMVKNECLDAFTVGRLKGRDIDGGIITENRDSGDE